MPLDRAHALLRNVPIGRCKFLGVLCRVQEHRLKIFEIEQQQALLVSITEHDIEDAFLRIVQV